MPRRAAPPKSAAGAGSVGTEQPCLTDFYGSTSRPTRSTAKNSLAKTALVNSSRTLKAKRYEVAYPPVKPVKLPKHLARLSPAKLSVAHLSPFGDKWAASPTKRITLTPTKQQRFAKSVQPEKPMPCVKRLAFDDDDDEAGTSKDEQPAYKRFSHLIAKGPTTPIKAPATPTDVQLPLPDKFQNLYNAFKIIDQLVWTRTKRHQLCTLKKLQEDFIHSTRKALREEHLAKFQTVGELDGTSWFKLSHTVHDGERHLAIATNVGDSVKCINSVTVLLERERRFRSILVEQVKKSHLQFLSSMNIPLDKSLTIFKWHAMFKLDTVPDIVPNLDLLPKLEKKTFDKNSILNYLVAKNDTSADVILPGTTGKACDKAVKKEEASTTTPAASTSSDKASDKKPEVKPKGKLPQSDKFLALLEKVKAKEASKLAKTMYRTPEVERELAMLGRLGEIIQIIYVQFSTAKAKSIPLINVATTISNSFSRAFDSNGVLKHLDYLLSLKLGYLPEFNPKDFKAGEDNTQLWLKKVRVDGTDYLQMDSKAKLALLLKQIEQKTKSLEA